MRILTPPGVFRPHNDSWLLAAAIAREPLGPSSRVLDVCTGSGVLAVAAARAGAGSVTAVDVSRRAVLTAAINARRNGVRVHPRRGSLFDPVAGRRFDLIVSNPPYVPAADAGLPQSGARRAWDAGLDGRMLLDRICEGAAEHLRPGGQVMLVHSEVNGTQATLDALAATGLAPRVALRHHGPLGPLLTARRALLERRGLLQPDANEEEVVIVTGTLAAPGRSPAGFAPTAPREPVAS